MKEYLIIDLNKNFLFYDNYFWKLIIFLFFKCL